MRVFTPALPIKQCVEGRTGRGKAFRTNGPNLVPMEKRPKEKYNEGKNSYKSRHQVAEWRYDRTTILREAGVVIR